MEEEQQIGRGTCLRYISLFSGIEAASVAWEKLGWKPVAFSEIEPFPKAILAYHYPNVPDMGDMTKVDWAQFKGKADVLVGGSPCFPRGTLVTTSDGLVPIEDVQVGDSVLTHKNHWQRVLNCGCHVANGTIEVTVGKHGLRTECTPNHPFLSRKVIGSRQKAKLNLSNNNVISALTYKLSYKPEWTKACNLMGYACGLAGLFVPAGTLYDGILRDDVKGGKYQVAYGNPYEALVNDSGLWHFLGWWMSGYGDATAMEELSGDDMVTKGGYTWIVTVPMERADELVNDIGHGRFSEIAESTEVELQGETALQLVLNGSQLDSLIERTLYDMLMYSEPRWTHLHGRLHRKRVGGLLLDAPTYQKEAFLDGWLHAIGTCSDGAMMASFEKTLDGRKSCIEIRMLATSLLRDCVIVEANDDEGGRYLLRIADGDRKCEPIDDTTVMDRYCVWQCVSHIKPTDSDTTLVYNLEVENDHSYSVDGIIVHNCQSYSISGLRKGLDDPRGQLMLEYLRAARDIDPDWVVWENVPGVLSAHGGRDFQTLLEGVAQLWPSGGAVWRVLDAQYFGVPQCRRRVFLVINTRDWRRAREIFFESGDVQGNTATSAEGWQTNTRASGCGASEDERHRRHNGTRDDTDGLTDADRERLVAERYGDVICMTNTTAHAKISATQCGTLTVGGDEPFIVTSKHVIRKLTPEECERLQAFPAGWTRIPWNNKPAEECPDGLRYDVIGNSMCTNVMYWIGRRIQEVNDKFDNTQNEEQQNQIT